MRRGVGADQERVTIEMIDGGSVHVITTFGARRTMPLDFQRGKGLTPQVGETWLIDRSLGYWMLASCLTPKLPVVSGNYLIDGEGAKLLDALSNAGVISDTTDRVAPPTPDPLPEATNTYYTGGETLKLLAELDAGGIVTDSSVATPPPEITGDYIIGGESAKILDALSTANLITDSTSRVAAPVPATPPYGILLQTDRVTPSSSPIYTGYWDAISQAITVPSAGTIIIHFIGKIAGHGSFADCVLVWDDNTPISSEMITFPGSSPIFLMIRRTTVTAGAHTWKLKVDGTAPTEFSTLSGTYTVTLFPDAV